MSAEDSMRILGSALGIIVAWASRHDIYAETMRRARCDLTYGDSRLLGRLNAGGPLRIGELADLLGIDSSTITPQARRLQRTGLIMRAPDPTDGRAALLTITPAGQKLLKRVNRSRRELLIERLRDWPEAERAAAAAALSRLANAL
ncbi:MAG: hypothetical protein QOG80_776 [Pseudonocardiales bacterium]|jgi:DNA-binding MarR family transcriptional regulator|nr:hypothetical protein [Pseudonocardiales bacterium]